VKTLEHFQKYLYEQEFHLCHDHSTLMRLLGFKNLEGLEGCWVQHLQEYNFTLEHHPGQKHANRDALSRRPCPEECTYCQKVE
jgi:hypothetical protein